MEHGVELERTAVTVCICTFRRPYVLVTIESVAKQALPAGTSLGIVVIDNDAEATAQRRIEDYCAESNIRVDYRHVPGQNISIARNAGLDAAATPWLVFLDDDEFAAPNWLANLLGARSGANAVFGPCEAIYRKGTSSWITGGDYHSNRVLSNRPFDTGYTSNALIDMNFVRQHGLRFDTALGRTGGEDSIFFHAIFRKCGVLKYVPEAIVYEEVVPARMTLSWIAKRRYRAGQVYAMMYEPFERPTYWRLTWASPVKVAVCIAMSAMTAYSPARAMWWLMRGVYHFGTLSFALGAALHQEYASPAEDVGAATTPNPGRAAQIEGRSSSNKTSSY